ncbi:hypothetical protein I6I09_02480 [Corynebacterium bovis]|nr:hypothetical protein [Corynebacterium bovis]QQC47829.1 hypothetical protein I6I09_02480 [Corynebacterium bovis]
MTTPPRAPAPRRLRRSRRTARAAPSTSDRSSSGSVLPSASRQNRRTPASIVVSCRGPSRPAAKSTVAVIRSRLTSTSDPG